MTVGNLGAVDQVRFLDHDGKEKIRVQSSDNGAAVVKERDLQFKSRRYYFQKAIKLAPDEFYFSPVDLNVERGQVEVPFKPVTRAGTSVFLHDGVSRGVVLINVSMGAIFDKVREIAEQLPGSFSFLNHEGYYLMAEDPALQWSFMFPDEQQEKFLNDFPAAWAKMKSGELLLMTSQFPS